MKIVRVRRVSKKEDGTYSVLCSDGKWYNNLKGKFKVGSIIGIEGNKICINVFEKKLKEKVREIKDDYEEAIEIFRSVVGREPVGNEFAMLNNIVLMLQRARFHIQKELEDETY